MQLNVRKTYMSMETIQPDPGHPGEKPLKKVAAAAVVVNPYAGRYAEDLSDLILGSKQLARELGRMAAECLGEPVEGYGKGGIAGVAGEQEHANALLTSVFGDEFREAIGGGKAWISSNTKRGLPGAAIDIPVNYKDALWVRSHYDTVEVRVPDAPQADEVLMIVVVTNRGRLNDRVGGLRKEAVEGADGLR